MRGAPNLIDCFWEEFRLLSATKIGGRHQNICKIEMNAENIIKNISICPFSVSLRAFFNVNGYAGDNCFWSERTSNSMCACFYKINFYNCKFL